MNDKNWSVDFKLVAPPSYQIEVVTHKRTEGEELLKKAVKIMTKIMKENGGKCDHVSKPIIIKSGTNKDEPDYSELMEMVQNKNDETTPSEDEGMGQISDFSDEDLGIDNEGEICEEQKQEEAAMKKPKKKQRVEEEEEKKVPKNP